MKKQVSIVLFIVVFICLNAVVFAQDDADIRKELDAQYKKLAEAHDRKDLKAIAALKTSDFHAIFADGKVGDVRTMEQYVKQYLETNQPPYNIRFTIQKLNVSENNLLAVAEVLQEAAIYRDLAGKRRKVETSIVHREIWAKTSDGWKLKSLDNAREMKRFVDGKRIDPTKPYNPDEPPYKPDDNGTKKQ